MEFLQILICFIAVVLMIKKPQKENLIFCLILFSWIFMAGLYFAHSSNEIFANIAF